jgi:two-component system chemotaxis sensor kinase CheA
MTKITDVSGRGVGLDVVKTKIEALEGIIEVETQEGKGSRFIIRLPLTLAIIQGLLVKINLEKYAIPLSSIKEIIDVAPSEVKQIQKKEVILRRNQVIPLIRLDEVLNVEKAERDPEQPLTVVIVKKSDKFAGFIIDELIGQQEIVIKSLGKYLTGINIIAGATILGDGQVALILDVNSLV